MIDTASGDRVNYRPEDLFGFAADTVDYRASYRYGPKAGGNVFVYFHELIVGVPAG